MASSCRDREAPGFAENFVAEVGAQALGRVQIDLSLEELAQLVLEGDEAEARGAPRLELDEHVDVALRREVIAEDAPEQREADDAVAPEELGDTIGGNVDRELGHRETIRLGFDSGSVGLPTLDVSAGVSGAAR